MALDRHATSAYVHLANISQNAARGVFNSKRRGDSNQAVKAGKLGLGCT
jgi:hypothetical protein